MTAPFYQKVSLCMLTTCLFSAPWSALAQESTITPPAVSNPSTIASEAPWLTLSWKKEIEEHREGEKPRSPFALNEKLDAYSFTVKNNRPNPVQIISSQLPNHVTPELAYLKVKQSAGMLYAQNALLGVAAAPFTMGFTLITGALIFGPIAAATAGSKNQTSLTFINQHPGIIPSDTLQSGESKQYQLLTEKNSIPTVQLTVQDLKTQTEWSISQ